VPVGRISAGWMVYAANNTYHVSENMKPRYLIDPDELDFDMDALIGSAQQASVFLKALANEARLLILCLLIEGEKSVTEIEEILSLRQPAISQQLARLRADGLVETRREGKNIFYSLARPEVREIIGALHSAFCRRPRTLLRRAGSRPTIVHAAARAKVAERGVRSVPVKRSSR
jgi:DNA-binding transcriptional ArsR family regulator